MVSGKGGVQVESFDNLTPMQHELHAPEKEGQHGELWWFCARVADSAHAQVVGNRRRAMRVLAAFSAILILGVPLTQWFEVSGIRWFGQHKVVDSYSWAAMLLVLAMLGLSYLAIRRIVRPLLSRASRPGHNPRDSVTACVGTDGCGARHPEPDLGRKPFQSLRLSASATLLLALLGVNAYYLGINPTEADHNDTINSMKEFMREFGLNLPFGSWLEPDPHGRRPYEANRRNLSLFLRLARLPFLMLISLPALFPRPFDFVPGNAPSVLSQAAEINFAKRERPP